MKTLKTRTGRELKITFNKSLRHYTIKTQSGKYRTYKLSQEEFNSMDYFTSNDCQNFLTTDEYFKVR